jgi:hypothetical protein
MRTVFGVVGCSTQIMRILATLSRRVDERRTEGEETLTPSNSFFFAGVPCFWPSGGREAEAGVGGTERGYLSA